MAKHKGLLILYILLNLLLLAGCVKFKDPVYRKVTITGPAFCFNYSRSFGSFGSMAEENDSTALMVAGGDLLYILIDDQPLTLRYRETDGLYLSFSIDTADHFKIYQEEKIISLNLSDDSDAWNWIEKSNRTAFENLRSLYITSIPSGEQITSLKKISEINPNLGLALEFEDNQQVIEDILSVFNPTWLVLPDIELKNITGEIIQNLKNLEFLSLAGDNLQDLDFIYLLPKLSSLIIQGWDPQTNGGYRFKDIKNLESLTFIESEITDISSIGFLPDLKSIHFVECDTLSEINTLSRFTNLKSLGFIQCGKISDISVINDIPSLTWLSLPPNTSQENFTGIMETHLFLQVVELIGCKEINDLSPLEKLSDLRAISLDVPVTDFVSLYQLTGLELIIFEEDMFEEQGEAISGLQDALPDTQIVPGGGLCLGSGWILLLIPLVLTFRIISMLSKTIHSR
ncbi:hypothetical protein ES705_30347 [subsurface metagenome]